MSVSIKKRKNSKEKVREKWTRKTKIKKVLFWRAKDSDFGVEFSLFISGFYWTASKSEEKDKNKNPKHDKLRHLSFVQKE